MALGILYYLVLFNFYCVLSAIIFYVLSKPAVDKLIKRRGWKKENIALLVIFVSVFVILMPISLFITLLYSKISAAVMNPHLIIENVKHVSDYINEQFGMQVVTDGNIEALKSYGTTFLSSILSQGLTLFTTIIMMYFFCFYDKEYRENGGSHTLLSSFQKRKIKISRKRVGTNVQQCGGYSDDRRSAGVLRVI